jgi:hypothetical protein
VQEAAEHTESQKRWLVSRVLQLEAELDDERAAHDAAADDADDAAVNVRALESKARAFSAPPCVLCQPCSDGCE